MTDIASSLVSDALAQSDAHLKSAMVALRAGDLVGAAQAAQQARTIDQSPRVLIVFAAISHAMGKDADALSMLEQAMAVAPDVGNYPEAAAAILLKLGRKSDGLFNLKLGTHLPSDPFLDEIVGDFFGKIKEIFDSFIENRPLTTARLMMAQGMYSAALRQLETFVGISGGEPESFSLLVECAVHLGLCQEAEVAFNALSSMQPDHPKLADYSLGIAMLQGNASRVAESSARLKNVGDLDTALDRFRLLELSPLVDGKILAETLNNIQKLTVPNDDVDEFSSAGWSDVVSVGFICTSIDAALENLLLALREHMPVKVYLLGTGNSPSQQRIRVAFEDFRHVASVDDATLIEMVRFDRVTVLFDTVGAGPFARPALWRTRMAPIQVLWSVASTYDNAQCYDYFLADDASNANSRALDIGTPVRFPVPPAELMGRVAEVRAMTVRRDGKEPRARRLLAPHSNAMMTDVTIQTYIDILAAVPESTLAFVAVPELDNPLVQRVLAAATAQECADRVELIDPMEFMKSRSEIMRDADLLLDSFPYGNAEMVMECLWTACPVLTLDGSSPRSRASSSLMHASGLTDLVADTVVAYRDMAVQLLSSDVAMERIVGALRELPKLNTLARYETAARALSRKIESLWAVRRAKSN